MNINEWKWFPSFPFKHRETSSSGLRDWGSSSDNVWKDFGGCAGTLDFGGTNWDVPPAWQSSNSVVLEPGVRLHWRFWMILSLCFVQTFMCFFGRFVRCWPETRSFPDAIQVRPPSLLRQCRGEKHRKAFWGTEFAAPRYANVGKKRILEVCLRKKIKRA